MCWPPMSLIYSYGKTKQKIYLGKKTHTHNLLAKLGSFQITYNYVQVNHPPTHCKVYRHSLVCLYKKSDSVCTASIKTWLYNISIISVVYIYYLIQKDNFKKHKSNFILTRLYQNRQIAKAFLAALESNNSSASQYLPLSRYHLFFHPLLTPIYTYTYYLSTKLWQVVVV